MDTKLEAGTPFDNHSRRKNEVLLVDITIVNLCTSFNLENVERHAGKHLADAVEQKEDRYRSFFAATYSLLSLAMWKCGQVGSDVHTPLKELAI